MPRQVHSGLSATGKQRFSQQLLSLSSHRRLARRRPQGRASRPVFHVIQGVFDTSRLLMRHALQHIKEWSSFSCCQEGAC